MVEDNIFLMLPRKDHDKYSRSYHKEGFHRDTFAWILDPSHGDEPGERKFSLIKHNLGSIFLEQFIDPQLLSGDISVLIEKKRFDIFIEGERFVAAFEIKTTFPSGKQEWDDSIKTYLEKLDGIKGNKKSFFFLVRPTPSKAKASHQGIRDADNIVRNHGGTSLSWGEVSRKLARAFEQVESGQLSERIKLVIGDFITFLDITWKA